MWALLCVVVFIFGLSVRGARAEVTSPARSIEELRQRLEVIRSKSHTPGVSVALVRDREVVWTAGLGVSNVHAGTPATEHTLFRLGSISKGLVALAVLQLVSQGKLSLDDSVRRLAPEVSFQNPWESTHPVRVADLLEHTTGWDDLSLRELAKDASGMTLREALEFDPRSRTSRWRPGTRSSYGYSGPAVAAFVVEKLAFAPFEDFVRDSLLRPIGMATATYAEKPSPELATLYHADGITPYPYWNALYRPSVSLNASAKDMAAYLLFFLARGRALGRDIMPPELLARMDIPTRNWAVQLGAITGDGLGSGTVVRQGLSYQGHSGSVPGGLSILEYLDEAGVGYYYAINSKNRQAYELIGDEIRAYLTAQLALPLRPSEPASTGHSALPADASDYSGWYEPAASRFARNDYLERIFGLKYASWQGERLSVKGAFGAAFFAPAGGRLLRLEGGEEPRSAVATSALIPDNDEGRFAYLEGWLRQIPTWTAWLRLGAVVACSLALSAGVLIGMLIWFQPQTPRRSVERKLFAGPLFATANLAWVAAMGLVPREDPVAAFGQVTFSSVSLCFATVLFAVGAAASAWVFLQGGSVPVRRWVRLGALFATLGLLVTAAYLGSFGVIGLRTWA